MVNEMLFIYSLSCEGNVFYIGRTKHLAKRYKKHLSCSECLPVHKYISELIKADKTILMNMLYYLPYKEAVRKEMEVIHLFSKAGHKLCNTTGTHVDSWSWVKKPININDRTMTEYLKELQTSKEETHIFWQEYNNTKVINNE
jgi:predicted GIY-YIG superfamily endonuclease